MADLRCLPGVLFNKKTIPLPCSHPDSSGFPAFRSKLSNPESPFSHRFPASFIIFLVKHLVASIKMLGDSQDLLSHSYHPFDFWLGMA